MAPWAFTLIRLGSSWIYTVLFMYSFMFQMAYSFLRLMTNAFFARLELMRNNSGRFIGLAHDEFKRKAAELIANRSHLSNLIAMVTRITKPDATVEAVVQEMATLESPSEADGTQPVDINADKDTNETGPIGFDKARQKLIEALAASIVASTAIQRAAPAVSFQTLLLGAAMRVLTFFLQLAFVLASFRSAVVGPSTAGKNE